MQKESSLGEIYSAHMQKESCLGEIYNDFM